MIISVLPRGWSRDGIHVAAGKAMEAAQISPRLCYLQAAQIRGPVETFDHLGLKGRDNEDLGRLDGIIIDAVARRMQYFVVEEGFLRRRRYLLPLYPTELDAHENVLRVDVDKSELSECARFNPASFRTYSEEDLLAAMFHGYHDDLDGKR
jgi:PRC-barrel domain protein